MADHGELDEDLALAPPAPPRSGQRRALWAVLAVVALAAGTVVATSGDDDERPTALPVSLSGAAREASADAAGTSLAWIHWTAAEALPLLGGEGTAYRLRPAVTEGAVRELAAALGLEAEIQRDGWAWRVDGGDRALEVDETSGSWWYRGADLGTSSSNGADPDAQVADGSAGAGGGAEPCEPGTQCTVTEVAPSTTYAPDCTPNGCPEPSPVDDCFADCSTEPAPPGCTGDDCTTTIEPCAPDEGCGTDLEPGPTAPVVDLPSEDDAVQVALRVAESAGVDVGDAQTTVDGTAEAWLVTVEPVIGGAPVGGWATYVAIGPDRAVLHAGGLLASAEEVGAHPLLDTRAAIDRLNALQGTASGAGVGSEAETGSAADGGSAGATTGSSSSTSASGSTDARASAPAAPSAGATAPITTPCDPDAPPEDPVACDPATADPGAGCAEPATPEGQERCTPTTLAVACPDVTEDMEPYVGPCPGEALCEPQEDGSAVCEPVTTTIVDPGPVPEPMLEPQPIEVVLTGAERVLVLLPANDGSTDSYLLPGYLLTSDDGHAVEVVAVVDESLSGGPADTAVPETTHPGPDEPVVTGPAQPQDCHVLVEGDGSGTTHTVQTCPPATTILDPQELPPGEAPIVGVPYYVDVDLSCGGGSFVLGEADGLRLIWVLEQGDTSTWSTGHEGGTFTLDAEDHGTFVGDAQGQKRATFRTLGPAEDIFCTPQPRP